MPIKSGRRGAIDRASAAIGFLALGILFLEPASVFAQTSRLTPDSFASDLCKGRIEETLKFANFCKDFEPGTYFDHFPDRYACTNEMAQKHLNVCICQALPGTPRADCASEVVALNGKPEECLAVGEIDEQYRCLAMANKILKRAELCEMLPQREDWPNRNSCLAEVPLDYSNSKAFFGLLGLFSLLALSFLFLKKAFQENGLKAAIFCTTPAILILLSYFSLDLLSFNPLVSFLKGALAIMLLLTVLAWAILLLEKALKTEWRSGGKWLFLGFVFLSLISEVFLGLYLPLIHSPSPIWFRLLHESLQPIIQSLLLLSFLAVPLFSGLLAWIRLKRAGENKALRRGLAFFLSFWALLIACLGGLVLFVVYVVIPALP